jgi:hypothetical protein
MYSGSARHRGFERPYPQAKLLVPAGSVDADLADDGGGLRRGAGQRLDQRVAPVAPAALTLSIGQWSDYTRYVTTNCRKTSA